MNRDTGDAGLYVELPLAEADRARLRELGPGPVWFAEPGTASEADARAFSDAGTALGNPRAAWVANAPRLRWLQLASVGIDGYLGLDWPALGRDLAVTNLGDLFADPVAQSCLAGILALHRGIDRLSGLRAEAGWAKSAVRSQLRLLTGARVLVLGRGRSPGGSPSCSARSAAPFRTSRAAPAISAPWPSSTSNCLASTWWWGCCPGRPKRADCSMRGGWP